VLGHGKITLLAPIEWTADGWPRIPAGWNVNEPDRKPSGEAVRHAGLSLTNIPPATSVEPQPSRQ